MTPWTTARQAPLSSTVSWSLLKFMSTDSDIYTKRTKLLLLNTSVQSVQSLSHVQLFTTPWTEVRQASLSITNSRSLLKLMSIESVMPFNHLVLFHHLLFPPSIFSRIRVFSNESVLCIRWPSIGVSASTSVLPMNTQDLSPLRWTGWTP